jgi:hypothetical protein
VRKKTVCFSEPPLKRTKRARAAYIILDACMSKLGQWAEAPSKIRFDSFVCGLNVAGFALEIRKPHGKSKQWVRIVKRAP